MKKEQSNIEFPDMDIPEITEVNQPEIGETTPHPVSPDEPQAETRTDDNQRGS